jgi:hypothetical protein
MYGHSNGLTHQPKNNMGHLIWKFPKMGVHTPQIIQDQFFSIESHGFGDTT